MRKIAVLAHRLDALFFPDNLSSASVYYLVPHEHIWLRSILKDKNVIPFLLTKKINVDDVSDDDIIKHSNITALLKARKIPSFLVSHRGSLTLKRWASQNNIELIGTDCDDQIYYENKLNFDRFLKMLLVSSPDSKTVKGGDKPFVFPFVVQEPASFGSFGTYIIKDHDSWLAAKHSLSPARNYLAREFVEGTTFGITIYIDDFRIALSAMRQQCFYRNTTTFAGVQWKRTDHFKKKTINLLNQTLLHLGLALQDRGFFGFANIDFILQPNGAISILECNPRLSSASPHLFGVPQTFGGIPIADMYLSKGELSNPPQFFFYSIPDSTFEGSLFDVVHIGEKKSPYPLSQSGSFTLTDSVNFISPRVPSLRAKSDVFLFYAHSLAQSTVEKGAQIGAVICNFPLFTGNGTLNKKALTIHQHFTHG